MPLGPHWAGASRRHGRCSDLLAAPLLACCMSCHVDVIEAELPGAERRILPEDGAVRAGLLYKKTVRFPVAQPNGSRLSCGALTNNSFPNLRAPSASSAC